MDITDWLFATNSDWDPCYLRDLFSQDFCEFEDLWQSSISGMELIQADREVPPRYSPDIEDISLDDDTLYEAIEQIEHE